MNNLEELNVVYQRFIGLTTTVLDDKSSIILFNNASGYFDISYKDKSSWRNVQFFDLEFALTVLDAIEKCNTISELLDYLDV